MTMMMMMMMMISKDDDSGISDLVAIGDWLLIIRVGIHLIEIWRRRRMVLWEEEVVDPVWVG